MEWLNSLFFEHTPLQAVVILSIIIAVGLGLGKIHLFGISLGVTFVFFAGILAGHLGFLRLCISKADAINQWDATTGE